MKRGILGTLGAWLTGAGLSLGQTEFRPAQGFVYPGAPPIYSASVAQPVPGYGQQVYPMMGGGYYPTTAPITLVQAPMYPPALSYPGAWQHPGQWGRPVMPYPGQSYVIPVVLMQQQLPYPTPLNPAIPRLGTFSAPIRSGPVQATPEQPAPAAGRMPEADEGKQGGTVIETSPPPAAANPIEEAAPSVIERTQPGELPGHAAPTTPSTEPPGGSLPPAATPSVSSEASCEGKGHVQKSKKSLGWTWKKKGHEVPCEGACAPGKPVGEKKSLWGARDAVHEENGSRFWFTADYLRWILKNGDLPSAIVLSNGSVVLGTSELDYEDLNGARVRFGFCLTDCLAVELGGFWLQQGEDSQFTGSAGSPTLTRPTMTGAALPLATLNTLAGTAGIDSSSQLFGGEANLLWSLSRQECYRLNLIGGVRYLRLDEDLDVFSSARGLNGTVFLQDIRDRSECENQFYGGQIGLQASYRWKGLSLTATGKIAAGITHESVTNTGSTQTRANGTETAGPGALGGRAPGQRTETEFGIVPEGSVDVGYLFTPNFGVNVGYTFLYWSSVARPGEQFGPTIVDTPFWAQGVNVGLTLRY